MSRPPKEVNLFEESIDSLKVELRRLLHGKWLVSELSTTSLNQERLLKVEYRSSTIHCENLLVITPQDFEDQTPKQLAWWWAKKALQALKQNQESISEQ
jgi:hypothetical protein